MQLVQAPAFATHESTYAAAVAQWDSYRRELRTLLLPSHRQFVHHNSVWSRLCPDGLTRSLASYVPPPVFPLADSGSLAPGKRLIYFFFA